MIERKFVALGAVFAGAVLAIGVSLATADYVKTRCAGGRMVWYCSGTFEASAK